MAINYSCNPEVDFVQAMIPHHQGAVDMCAVLLAGTLRDAFLDALCENITRVQNAEIMWMQGWLQESGHPLGASCSGAKPTSTCADMLPITDLCHDLGGDGFCSCSRLKANCSHSVVHRESGRSFQVDAVCKKTCFKCSSHATSAGTAMELVEVYRSAKGAGALQSTPSATISSQLANIAFILSALALLPSLRC